LSLSSVDSSVLNQSIDTNGSLHEQLELELDTECFMLMGLLFCRDRYSRKAQVFYSILKSDYTQSCSSLPSPSMNNNSGLFEELYCLDDAVESTVFKMCVLSSMLVEFHALPSRPGRTEVKMLQTSFAMRNNVYFKVFQTFI